MYPCMPYSPIHNARVTAVVSARIKFVVVLRSAYVGHCVSNGGGDGDDVIVTFNTIVKTKITLLLR